MIDGAIQDYKLTLDKILYHAAKWHPDAEVVSSVDGAVRRIGYAQLYERARRVSACLASRGVRRGDRVATLAWNSQGHVEAWYGIMAIGAVCHTLNPRLTAEQIAAMIDQSEASILLVSGDMQELARSIALVANGVREILVLDDMVVQTADGGDRAVTASLDLDGAGDVSKILWGDFDETTPCGLCFTSGTTGAPKGVTYTHRSNFLHTMRQLQSEVMGLGAHDSVLIAVPMFHANAWGLPFSAPAVGARMVLPGRHLDGASLARLIREESVTVGVGVPTIWLGLVEHLEAEGGDLPSLERLAVGGTSMPPALMSRIEKRLGVRVQTTWGMTELSPLGTATPPQTDHRRPEVSGRPAIGVDLLLTDSDGSPLAQQRGEEGHLKVRGAAVVKRYFGHQDSAVDADGWFDTGDLARIEADGSLIITGRSKDLIKSGGEWINPVEIEAIIGALPQVSLAAVIGRSDDKWGERPILLVETCDHNISDGQLLDSLTGRVASWWIPDAVVRIETMPLAATGKIDKMRLRLEYGQALA